QEFDEGIAKKERALSLGDTGASDPCGWELGGPRTENTAPIHVLLMVQAKSREELSQYCENQLNLFADTGKVVATEEGTALPGDKEHFGFRDSISQPEIEDSPKPPPPDQASLEPGEFVLGYLNEYGVFPPTPTVAASSDGGDQLQPLPQADAKSNERDFGRNGSYLVFRKLEQDVAGFRRFLKENARTEEEMLLLGAKLMGRWQSGAPIVLAPDSDPQKDVPFDRDKHPENDFYYMEHDPAGYRCPVSSHVRRTNPRDSLGGTANESIRSVNRHRIIRRGVPYGPTLSPGVYENDGHSRGLLFFCINADIRRQFEFVQQTWANNPKFNGLYDDRDAIIGDNKDLSLTNSRGPYYATIPNNPLRQRCSDVSRFVTVKGGAYFFLPSISALCFLAGADNKNKPRELASAVSAWKGDVPKRQDLKLGQEYPPRSEEAAIRKIKRIVREKYEEDFEEGELARRDEHPKSHGCVKAQFIVHDNLPENLRYGVLKEPRTYPAWVRFSSSDPTSPSDTKRDAHGMAVKLMKVDGEKVLRDERYARTQDFVMANHNVFFVRSAAHYVRFISAFARGGVPGIVLSFVLGIKPFELRFLNPFKWRLHEFWNMLRATQTAITNPLQIQYWSQCPSKLGPDAMKFSARPCSSADGLQPANGVTPGVPWVLREVAKLFHRASPGDNFLQEAVTRQLKKEEVSFDFMVQLQTDPVKMPVEDSTIVWSEKLSPFQKVATIRIPTQDPDDKAQLDISEHLSFTPWHSLPDHRPLGNTNRIRRTVYELISRLRHQKNKVPRVEPTGTEAF
ncbi:MAG: Dyp-type peroxidase, partial [bacterium]